MIPWGHLYASQNYLWTCRMWNIEWALFTSQGYRCWPSWPNRFPSAFGKNSKTERKKQKSLSNISGLGFSITLFWINWKRLSSTVATPPPPHHESVQFISNDRRYFHSKARHLKQPRKRLTENLSQSLKDYIPIWKPSCKGQWPPLRITVFFFLSMIATGGNIKYRLWWKGITFWCLVTFN